MVARELKSCFFILVSTDNGHPERAFFQKFESFGLGQTNWAEILGGTLGISSQTIGTILALWVPCSWESEAGSFSYKKCWFLSLKHITPEYSQNKILAVKNLEKSLRTSILSTCLNENNRLWREMWLQLITEAKALYVNS